MNAAVRKNIKQKEHFKVYMISVRLFSWLSRFVRSLNSFALHPCAYKVFFIFEMTPQLKGVTLNNALKVTSGGSVFLVIPSFNDNWIVTAAIESLNKDTFQDDSSVDCLIIQRCFAVICARHTADFSACLPHFHLHCHRITCMHTSRCTSLPTCKHF